MHIIVIGGYGTFGKRLVKSLVDNYNHSITIAGRSESKAKQFCQQLTLQHTQTISHLELDTLHDNLAETFKHLKADVIVNASGPFQIQSSKNPYRVAQACIDNGCHYIDLADARDFVGGFSETLNQKAKDAGVMLVTGASTVPGLSAAVLDFYTPQFKELKTVEYCISPGNRAERGQATVSSILSYTGKPLSTLTDGKQKLIYGWQDLELFDFGSPLGKRWLGNCDIPDLDLLPQRYPNLETIRFKAGLEVTLLHCGLWFLSGLTRLGLVKNLNRYSRVLTRISEWFILLGSDSGGMHVRLNGTDSNNQEKTIHWQLIAEDGVGPNIPTISAELVINRIAEGNINPGAMPCMGLFTLTDFLSIASRWNIYHKEY